MSLPGCADQTIHADTPHIYVHTKLPAHYVNLFMPASGEAKDDNPGYDYKVRKYLDILNCLYKLYYIISTVLSVRVVRGVNEVTHSN